VEREGKVYKKEGGISNYWEAFLRELGKYKRKHKEIFLLLFFNFLNFCLGEREENY